MRNLIYADVETTGLDEKSGHLLEVALLAVQLPTFEQVASFSQVVVPPCWETVKRNMNEKVLEMHTNSGLMAALDGVQPEHHTAAQIELLAASFMQQWAPRTMGWHTPMAGANPSFDRRWLERHMPALAKRFHYRNYDVRTFTLTADWVFGTLVSEGAAHRALADCEKANDDVRRFLGLET
jgi:oligoribonuclease